MSPRNWEFRRARLKAYKESQKMQPEIYRLRAIVADLRNSKTVRQAAIRQLRPLEDAAKCGPFAAGSMNYGGK